jgi:hypothetical protein
MCELRALDALLACTGGGPPVCASLLRAWHAVALLDAALHDRPASSHAEFLERLASGDLGATPGGGARALDAVDPDGVVASIALPRPAHVAPPHATVLQRQRDALAAWCRDLEAQVDARHRRPVSRRALAAVGVAAVLLVVAIALAWRPPVWRVEYYRTESLVDPIASDFTRSVGGHWGTGSPHAGVPEDGFSSRWETCLVLGRPTDIVFRLGSDDGSRLAIDEHPIIDQWRPQPYSEQTAEVSLAAGVHSVRVEHFDASGDADLVLLAQVDRRGAFGALPRALLHAPRGRSTACAGAPIPISP